MPAEPAQSDRLVEAVARYIDARGLIAPRQGVLVAVSGGPDSVALLAVLRELAGRGGRAYQLTAAHLNHLLRDGAAADADFVAELTSRWDVPCICEARDVAACARRRRVSVETAAREVRYAFLAEAAERCGATAVATGHHADDNAETVLHRLLRGTHLRGLAGIPAMRPLGGGRVRLVRPLLDLRREQIRTFCRDRDLAWRTDETNAQTNCRRNFIRHELLPLLRERVNERVDEALLRLAAAAGDVEACLAEQGAAAARRAAEGAADSRGGPGGSDGGLCEQEGSSGCVSMDAASLAGEHRVVRTYALRSVLERLGVPLGKLTAERLAALAALAVADPPAAVSLPGGWRARREGDEVTVGAAPGGSGAVGEEVPLQCPGETRLPCGWRITCDRRAVDETEFRRHCRSHRPGVELLDAECLSGPLTCRPRRPGDAFVPLGAPGSQTVGDLLTNLKLTRRRRDRTRCVCDGRGIVYLAPLRIADRVKVTGETKTVLRIEIRQHAMADG